MNGIALVIMASAYSACVDSIADDSIKNQPLILCDTITRERLIAANTNVVPWAIGVANLGVEIGLSNSFSISVPVWWAPYFISKRYALRTLMLQPELRYWLKRQGNGHFFGVHLGTAWYNLRFKDIRYQDTDLPLLNGGFTYGYRLHLNKHFDAELSIGAGYIFTKYDRFYNIDNGARIDTRQTSYIGFDHIGISLVYYIDL